MEYIFGPSTRNHKDILCLKTKGEAFTHLGGDFSHTEEYSDCTITHTCHIKEHYHSAKDSEGNCYDWYEIDNYNHRINLADAERDRLNDEIDEITQYCGDLVEQVYQSDLEYVIGE